MIAESLLNGLPYVMDSGMPGPTLLIMGGIHGDELCGVEALAEIVRQQNRYMPQAGRLMLLYGNPAAIIAGKRYMDEDLNRTFRPQGEQDVRRAATIERSRMMEMETYMREADILLDIHASFTPQSEPFIICERNASSLLKALPIEKVCYGFDAVQPGGTDYYMNAIGKCGMCVECGDLRDPAGSSLAIACCQAMMSALGMIKTNTVLPIRQQYFQAIEQYRTASDSFLLKKRFRDFEYIPRGSVIGTDGDMPVIATDDGYILFAADRFKRGSEAFVALRAVDQITPLPLPPPSPSSYLPV